ncbi:hypothetical protein SAMN05421824_1477 [Hyunsoonleella jejuensis]|uniref:Outer membrane protein beta-barrel domain-containing protein n=1 Tax=Hyunsoonleella jejuensis TaxID=419940 RepID=A0A1H9FGV8_9FLAO|nr:hypothetical protein [Hyunsoonleella jejuensis]SEQ37142.1 hypothetical protein SAMN05421824_1477 [Hyunsoonleella jejuensis]
MRIKLFIAVLLFSGSLCLNAQTFKIGASAGLPTADASDISSFVLGVDAYYFFTDVDALIEIGLNAGYRNYFGKEYEFGNVTVEAEDVGFLPLALAARLKLFGLISGGADAGYAVALEDGLDGGLYFKPVAGLDIADTIELNLGHEFIFADGATWGNFCLGLLFEF